MNEQDRTRADSGAEKGYRLKELFHRSDDSTVRLKQKMLLEAVAALCVCLVLAVGIMGITAAWYTNVVETKPLVVQADSWGFLGTVAVNSSIKAAPGDSGTLGMVTVQNEGDRDARVRMDVDKSDMDPEMQRRIFFYTVDEDVRVWINGRQPYIFTVQKAADEETPTIKNLEQVRWMWVYDLLGYYVLGSLENDTVTELELLSPVEYDLDTAVFDTDGTLSGADRSALVPEGVTEGPSGYYLLEDYGDGTGLYLRLLNRQEIQEATAYDTALMGGVNSFSLKLNFTGENIRPQEGQSEPGSQG